MVKNTAGQKIGAQMVRATDGSAFTSSVTVAVTVDAGTQATGSVGSGACTHEGNGYHTYAPAQAETNGTLLAFTFTGTGAVPSTVQVFTTGFDPTAAQVPANVTQFGGSNGSFSSGVPAVNASQFGGAAVTATTSVTIPASSTLATTTGAVGSVTGAVGSVAGNVGGNVVGSVASVTAGVTVTTNNDKTGYALSSAGVQAVWDTLTSALTTVGSAGKLLVDNLNATVSSRLASASYTAPLDAAGTRTALGMSSANLDTQLGTIAGYLDTEIAAILAAVDTEVAAIVALLDDPRTEPGQGNPPVNPDMATKVDYLYKFARNKVTQTATTLSIYADDATTVDQKATVSDDGTTFTRGELATGP